MKTKEDVLQYIKRSLIKSVRKDEDGSGFMGLDLPYPYTSPSIKGEGNYDFFFYWDTYFTNLGLLKYGYQDIAKSNIKNILWLIERQGYMPNHVGIYNRSQSPYLCRMLKDYFEYTGDEAFLKESSQALLQEYNWWMSARRSPLGLNCHGMHDTWKGQEEFAEESRVQKLCPSKGENLEEKRRTGAHFLAEAEASCDFTPRFEQRCLDYIQCDLNGLLYEYELFLGELSDMFQWNYAIDRRAMAEERRALIQQYLWNEDRGLYLDYDFVNGRHSPIAALTGMQLLAHGIPDTGQAERLVSGLSLFEREHGIAYTEPCNSCESYQWAFPNVWPPMVYMIVSGLNRYGFKDDAQRIAEKFVKTTVKLFDETGQLWEKTDAQSGKTAAGEYDAAAMLGWTAGVFVKCCDYMESGNI